MLFVSKKFLKSSLVSIILLWPSFAPQKDSKVSPKDSLLRIVFLQSQRNKSYESRWESFSPFETHTKHPHYSWNCNSIPCVDDMGLWCLHNKIWQNSQMLCILRIVCIFSSDLVISSAIDQTWVGILYLIFLVLEKQVSIKEKGSSLLPFLHDIKNHPA